MTVPAPAMSMPAAGGVEGVRIAVALALSLAVHAGAALWIDLPSPPAPAGAGTSVQVALLRAPPRAVLAPAPAAGVLAPTATVSPRPLAAESPTAEPLAAVAPPPASSAVAPETAAHRPAAPPPRVAAVRLVSARATQARPRRVVHPPPPAAAPAPAQATSEAARVAPVAALERPAAPARAEPIRPRDGGAAVEADTPPLPLAGNPTPDYPPLARRRGQQGRVVLRLQVAPDGRASQALILRSSGVDSLDHAARSAVSRWRFTPATRAGRPVAATVDVPVQFQLDGRG